MDYYGNPVTTLIEELARLPGIGRKTAQRLAFHIIGMPEDEVNALSVALVQARREVRYCRQCCTLTDSEICPICSDPSRDRGSIMVVEDSRDMAAYEKTKQYNGLYHILHGVISPLGGGFKDQGALGKASLRRSPRDHPGDESHSGGRNHRHVSVETYQAVGD